MTILRDLFTGLDGQTHDLGRWSWAGSFLAVVAAAVGNWWHGLALDVQALARSSLLKAHNRGDHAAAGRAFAMWNKAKVKGRLTVLPGLTARRAAEAALYLRPEPDSWRQPMPQAVASEPALAASPTVQSGAATAGVGALALIGQAGDTIGPIKATVDTAKSFASDTLGVPPGYVLPGLALVLGAVVLWRRYGQRAGGVA